MADVDHFVLSAAKNIAGPNREHYSQQDPTIVPLADAVLKLSGYEGPSEGLYYPATLSLNTLSNQPTDDHKALVIRLELMSWEYRGTLRGLIQEGIMRRRERVQQFDELLKRPFDEIPAPLRREDIEAAKRNAEREVQEAVDFLSKISEP